MNKLYEENAVQDIANAIREKNGLATLYKIGEMGQAIREIKTGASGLNVIRSATRPASADENTLWLETGVQDGTLTVSAVEPATPGDGDVWITPHNARPLEFPVFEGINLTMGVARLRAGNAWHFIDFAGYASGAWHTSHTAVFKDGAWGGLLGDGKVIAASYKAAGSGIIATMGISSGILYASGRSYDVKGGSGFTLLGTQLVEEISLYTWQRVTLQLLNAPEAYFGESLSDLTSGGTYNLQGTRILLNQAANYTTFSRAIDQVGEGAPGILVANPNNTVIENMRVNVSDWFLV